MSIGLVDNQDDLTYKCGTNDSEVDPRLDSPSSQPSTRQFNSAIVELAVFYDQWFEYKFRNDLHQYIRTVLRQMQIIFDYPTLTQVSIRFVVTKLEKVNPIEVPFHWKSYNYYDSFRHWQSNRYPIGSRDYDIAVLLSVKSFYEKADDSVPTMGRAAMGEACDLYWLNCVLVSVPGFMGSWYLAHEIGHLLNAYHDFDPRVKCDLQGVMGYTTKDQFQWSNCSNDKISKFLSSKGGGCLQNQPKNIVWDLKNDRSLPADNYDSDLQCSRAFGKKFREAPFDPRFTTDCQHLWCSYDLIRVNAMLPLEGTRCLINNSNQYGKCKAGQCV